MREEDDGAATKASIAVDPGIVSVGTCEARAIRGTAGAIDERTPFRVATGAGVSTCARMEI